MNAKDAAPTNGNTAYDKWFRAYQMVGLPTAIVAALMWFLGFEVWPFFRSQLESSTVMQQAVTDAITAQAEAAIETAHSQERIVTSLQENLKAVRDNGDSIKQNLANTEQTVKLMQSASELMKDTPGKRDEMVKLLRDISTSLKPKE